MANNLHTTPQGPGESSGSVLAGASASVSHYTYDRDRLEYELVVRQEPKQARMCGVGGKADRRPIDPPPIVQLRVIDPTKPSTPRRRRSSASGSDAGSSPHADPTNARDAVSYAQSYLQNPYYFMFASLAKPDDDAELHWLKDGRTRCTTGSVVSSLYHLKDPQNNNEDAGFFVFPDLSVRTEGSYRLKLSLFEVVGNNVRHCKSIYSAPFYVYTAKKFPGMEESTPLSCSLADQGIKIRIRKDIRVRKRPIHALEPLMQPLDGPSDERDDDEREDRDAQRTKRTRTDDAAESSGGADGNRLSTPQQWPPVPAIDPNLGPIIPPPSNAQTISAPSNSDSSTTSNAVAVAATSAYDARTSVYPSYEAQTPLTPQPTQSATTQTPYRSDGQLHPTSSQQQQIPPPPSQQQYHPPPTQHIPPPSHMPPPSAGHVTHHSVPPVQQPYAPYPGQAWPPQPQQQMYDPYAHYHHPQHPPPHPHYPTMPPAPTVHMQHAPPHHYSTPMYPQPPAPYPYAGYYEPPPHPHQNQHPQQYAPVPTNTSSPNNSVQAPAAPPSTAPPSTIPPPVPPTTGYVEYGPNPYGRGTSPQPRGYHTHTHPQPHYGPYPSPHPHPQHQPRHFAPFPPPHSYSYAYGHPPPVPTADQWGATATYAPHMPWGEAYGTPQAQSASVPPTAQPPAPNSTSMSTSASSSMSANASGLVSTASGHGDRIQLAPLRETVAAGSAGAAGVADAAPALAHASGSVGAGTASSAYLHMHSNGRNGYDTGRDRDDRGERDHDRLSGRAVKKNPLSIGSIISN